MVPSIGVRISPLYDHRCDSIGVLSRTSLPGPRRGPSVSGTRPSSPRRVSYRRSPSTLEFGTQVHLPKTPSVTPGSFRGPQDLTPEPTPTTPLNLSPPYFVLVLFPPDTLVFHLRPIPLPLVSLFNLYPVSLPPPTRPYEVSLDPSGEDKYG